MNRVHHRFAALAFSGAIFAVLLLSSGCAAIIHSSGPSHGASSLSEAAREAAKGEGEKHKELKREPEPPTVAVVSCEPCCEESDEEGGEEPSPSSGPSGPEDLHLGIVSSFSNVSGGPFRNAALTGLQLGARLYPQVELNAALMGSPMWLTPESGLSAGIAHPAELAGDASIRYYVSRSNQGPSLYPIAGLRLGAVLWDYRHPIAASDGETVAPIESDWVGYAAPYAGVGVALIRTAHFQLGAHVTGGYRFYEGATVEGFRNDLFRDAMFGQLTLETTIRF